MLRQVFPRRERVLPNDNMRIVIDREAKFRHCEMEFIRPETKAKSQKPAFHRGKKRTYIAISSRVRR